MHILEIDMWRILVLLSIFVACEAAAADSRLIGTWKSDHARSMKLIRTHTKLEDRQLNFLEQTLGHMVITFSETSVSATMPDIEVETSGKRQLLPGMTENSPYRVIGTDHNTVAILTENDQGEDWLIVYHFVGKDVFWVYFDGAGDGLVDLNIREYFSKIQ